MCTSHYKFHESRMKVSVSWGNKNNKINLDVTQKLRIWKLCAEVNNRISMSQKTINLWNAE